MLNTLETILFGNKPIQADKAAEIAKIKRQGLIAWLSYIAISLALALLPLFSQQELWQAGLVWTVQSVPLALFLIYAMRKRLAPYQEGAPQLNKQERLAQVNTVVKLGWLTGLSFVFGMLLDRSFDDKIPLLKLLTDPILMTFLLLALSIMIGFFYLIAKSQIDDEFGQ